MFLSEPVTTFVGYEYFDFKEPPVIIKEEELEELGPRVRKMSARMQEWVDQYGKESTTRRGHGFTKKRK
jgi:hypothetical protein